ncbi:hypothetical protein L3X38_012916 [Prunus dulcis]|uniref:Leucine-rich repeat-containing N-terminal plant-type domain-containing protein n=1 Tax=Prunus dulcis TaxID=3755 RepID=A0AAD4ZGI5_PRUDU|nr:hypothetical protein L3X38_012916 [Prunus dulcis]
MGIHLVVANFRMLSELLVLFVVSSCGCKLCILFAAAVSSWKPAGGGNSSCCSWDGVECDEMTGHVIGLNLSSSYLHGSFDSNSSFFSLVHLQRLNLSDNNFNHSQFPSSIRNFPGLTHLDLSFSFFSGQVPY